MTHRLLRLALASTLLLAAGACEPHDHGHDDHGHDDHGHDDHGHDDHGHDDHGHDDHGGDDHGGHHHGGDHHAAAEDESSAVFTVWAEGFELFVEAAPLAADQPARWLIHATRLEPYEAVEGATVTLHLEHGGRVTDFATTPRIPGIFVAETPLSAGDHTARVRIVEAGQSRELVLGVVSVRAPGTEVIDEPEEEGGISFLKEQQWMLPFAVTRARVESISHRFTVLGRIVPMSGRDTEIHAPLSGRLRLADGVATTDGARVSAGTTLGWVVPIPDVRDRIELERDLEQARAARDFAQAEFDRVAGLVTEGVLSDARRLELEAALETAGITFDNARRRLANWSDVERGEAQASRVAIIAPFDGTLTSSEFVDGAYVDADEPLARLTDVTRAMVEAHVPETDIGRIGAITSAQVYVASSEEPVVVELLDPPVTSGIVDPATHTLAVRFPLPATDAAIAAGVSARVLFADGEPRDAVVVDRDAVGDEDGVPVVYVQSSGETFERRIVRVGLLDGELAEIVDGVAEGEWVVSEGGWLVRLASRQSALPSHGHAH